MADRIVVFAETNEEAAVSIFRSEKPAPSIYKGAVPCHAERRLKDREPARAQPYVKDCPGDAPMDPDVPWQTRAV